MENLSVGKKQTNEKSQKNFGLGSKTCKIESWFGKLLFVFHVHIPIIIKNQKKKTTKVEEEEEEKWK